MDEVSIWMINTGTYLHYFVRIRITIIFINIFRKYYICFAEHKKQAFLISQETVYLLILHKAGIRIRIEISQKISRIYNYFRCQDFVTPKN